MRRPFDRTCTLKPASVLPAILSSAQFSRFWCIVFLSSSQANDSSKANFWETPYKFAAVRAVRVYMPLKASSLISSESKAWSYREVTRNETSEETTPRSKPVARPHKSSSLSKLAKKRKTIFVEITVHCRVMWYMSLYCNLSIFFDLMSFARVTRYPRG